MNHSRIHRLSRRDFLASTFALPAVTCVRVLASTGSQSPLAPYLALQEFIQPGYHGFAEEKEAMDIQRALHEAVRTLRLPLAAGAAGSSPMPKSFAAIAPDLIAAVFDPADTNIAAGWSQWVRALASISSFPFDALTGRVV